MACLSEPGKSPAFETVPSFVFVTVKVAGAIRSSSRTTPSRSRLNGRTIKRVPMEFAPLIITSGQRNYGCQAAVQSRPFVGGGSVREGEAPAEPAPQERRLPGQHKRIQNRIRTKTVAFG